MQFAFRTFAEVEARFTSVERLLHYIRNVKPEGKFETTHQGESWPEQGTIDFEAVSVCFFLTFIVMVFQGFKPSTWRFFVKRSPPIFFILFILFACQVWYCLGMILSYSLNLEHYPCPIIWK